MKLHHLRILLSFVPLTTVAAAEDFDPFEVPKEYFTERVRTVAIAPIQVPVGVDTDAVRQTIETRVTSALKAKGYAVLPSSVYREKWVGLSEKLGGVFDPVTGATKEDIWNTVYEYTARDLRKQHDADAVAFPNVLVSPLVAWNKSVGLDGIFHAANDEPLTWKGSPLQAHALNRPQRVLGTYLSLIIRDLNGDQMYGVRYPIEVTAVFLASSREEKPAERLFQNDSWIQKAVDRVVSYLPEAAASR